MAEQIISIDITHLVMAALEQHPEHEDEQG